MKKPRIEDFDPTAAERKLGSPLDDMPIIVKPTPRSNQPELKRSSLGETSIQTRVRSSEQYSVSLPSMKKPSKKVSRAEVNSRGYVRRTFDFYEDQIAFLTKSSLEERLAGGEGSMNAMVREALDRYIKAKKSAE